VHDRIVRLGDKVWHGLVAWWCLDRHPQRCGGNERSDDRGDRHPLKLDSVRWFVGHHPRRWLGVCRRLRCAGLKNVGQFADGVELIISDCGEGRSRRWVFKCMDKIECSLSGGTGRRGFGHAAVVWNFFDCLGNGLGLSFGDVDAVTPKMLRGRANVPALGNMWIPGGSVGQCFVDKKLAARRCKRGVIVVKSATELSVRQELGVLIPG
jgi:hypothetical protein